MPVIKKYSNRRMYDTEASRYVNLEDVAGMVRAGEEVQVIDAQSGDDLTRVVLTQIIVEGTKNKDYLLPTDFLRQMIMASGKAQQELWTRYFNFVFGLYDKAQVEVRERMTGSRPLLNPFETFQRLMSGQSPWNGAEHPSVEDEDDAEDIADDAAAELANLRRRLEELEAKLSKE